MLATDDEPAFGAALALDSRPRKRGYGIARRAEKIYLWHHKDFLEAPVRAGAFLHFKSWLGLDCREAFEPSAQVFCKNQRAFGVLHCAKLSASDRLVETGPTNARR